MAYRGVKRVNKAVYFLVVILSLALLLSFACLSSPEYLSNIHTGKIRFTVNIDNLTREGYIDERGYVPVIILLNITKQNTSSADDSRNVQRRMLSESDVQSQASKKEYSKDDFKNKVQFAANKINQITFAQTKIDSGSLQASRKNILVSGSSKQFFKTGAVSAKSAFIDAKPLKRNVKKQSRPNEIRELASIGAISTRIPVKSLQVLSRESFVRAIHLDERVNALLYDSVSQINATATWQLQDSNGTNLTGEGIKIAIIDTGVDYTLKDLGNCSPKKFMRGNCSKVIGGYDYVNMDNDPMDDMGHGTHVAAIAAGNGTLKGVAPNAKILAYKVMDYTGGGYDSDIINGIEQAVEDGADIISMSLGSVYCYFDDPLNVAVDEAVDAGVTVVVAAGNSGPFLYSIGDPGCDLKAITVGAACKPSQFGNASATDYCTTSMVAEFSSLGPARIYQKPDVIAPGVLICAQATNDILEEYPNRTCLDSSHIAMSGTSMATPHVAGAVALIKQKHPSWTPEQIKAALKYTATKVNLTDIFGNSFEAWPLYQGAGLINILRAANLSEPPPIARFGEISNVFYDE
jgi:subtilisin family serine protease